MCELRKRILRTEVLSHHLEHFIRFVQRKCVKTVSPEKKLCMGAGGPLR